MVTVNSLHDLLMDIDLPCRVVESFSRALLHEEKKNRYVSKQVAIMLRLMESMSSTPNRGAPGSNALAASNASVTISNSSASVASGTNAISGTTGGMQDDNPAASSNSSNNPTNTSNSNNTPLMIENDDLGIQLMEEKLQHSLLANELRAIYHGFAGTQDLHITSRHCNDHLTINDLHLILFYCRRSFGEYQCQWRTDTECKTLSSAIVT